MSSGSGVANLRNIEELAGDSKSGDKNVAADDEDDEEYENDGAFEENQDSDMEF